jgi:hypothetical protein
MMPGQEGWLPGAASAVPKGHKSSSRANRLAARSRPETFGGVLRYIAS